MPFYKLESTYKTVLTAANRSKERKTKSRTYKYYFNSSNSMLFRFEDEIEKGSTVRVKKISEADYVRNTR